MKLPRSLIALTGPVTKSSQATLLADLKQAFRNRAQQVSPPISSLVDEHLHSVLTHRSAAEHGKRVTYKDLNAGNAVKRAYVDGTISASLVHELIARAGTRSELDAVSFYSLKAGFDLTKCTNLSARYAARLLHLGYVADVAALIEKNTKAWMLTPSAHPLLLQYASRTGGMSRAQQVFSQLARLDTNRSKTNLIRTLLKESVRQRDIQHALRYIQLDIEACKGQESGLANWLCDKVPDVAFELLVRVEPALARETSVGVRIARAFLDRNQTERARSVLEWVKKRYVLSIQSEVAALEAALAGRRLGAKGEVSPGFSDVLAGASA